MNYNIPIAFIIFNRPDTTKTVFKEIAKAQPKTLYLISDAPREGNKDDEAKVAECRSFVESHIDWPCTLKKVYAGKNMGCRDRVYTGITEVFDHEDKAVIIEKETDFITILDNIILFDSFAIHFDILLSKHFVNER